MDILNDIRVLSFNHFLLGPMGTQVLADLGADVICIEPVGGAFQRHWASPRGMDGVILLVVDGEDGDGGEWRWSHVVCGQFVDGVRFEMAGGHFVAKRCSLSPPAAGKGGGRRCAL